MHLSQVICSKNNLFFVFLLVGYLFGVIFYDSLNLTYLDELMALFLTLFAGIVAWERKSWKVLRPLGIVCAIFLFYTVYSLLIHSNKPQAILTDLLIQLKPFLGFYCTLVIAPRFSDRQKRFLSILCLLIGGLLLIIGLIDPYHHFFGHPSRFATAAIATAFLFLYCNSLKWVDLVCFVAIFSIGFFSTRAKFYGSWAVAVCLVTYIKLGGILRLNWKTMLVCGVVGVAAIVLAWEKIVLYYVDGMMNSREMWSRPAMMLTSGRIFYDYFPLGSGLGSFGSYASAKYYSGIYADYGIDQLWGLSKQYPEFICDAYYPGLAQFGVVGAGLYAYFWILILRSTHVLPVKQQLFVWLVCAFFLIEGVADATFTHNRGLFILILLALCYNPKHEIEARNI